VEVVEVAMGRSCRGGRILPLTLPRASNRFSSFIISVAPRFHTGPLIPGAATWTGSGSGGGGGEGVRTEMEFARIWTPQMLERGRILRTHSDLLLFELSLSREFRRSARYNRRRAQLVHLDCDCRPRRYFARRFVGLDIFENRSGRATESTGGPRGAGSGALMFDATRDSGGPWCACST
jgi:hypothetical protein